EPASTILGDSSGEIAEIHLEMVVYRDRADRPAPESSHVRDLVERVMGFARDVDRRRCGEALEPVLAIVREGSGQCDDDRRQIRLRAAAREASEGMGGEAELLRQP